MGLERIVPSGESLKEGVESGIGDFETIKENRSGEEIGSMMEEKSK